MRDKVTKCLFVRRAVRIDAVSIRTANRVRVSL